MSLRSRILLLTLVAILAPVLSTFWLLLVNRDSAVADARDKLASRVELISRDLNDKIAGSTQLLFGLGRVPLLDGADKDACSSFLNRVLKEHPQYTGILTIRPDGGLHCDSLLTGRKLQLADRGYFKQAKMSQTTVVEPVYGRLTGKAVLQIAYPVRAENGALRYILLASLDLNTYAQSLQAELPYAQSIFQIWNRDGSFIATYPKSANTAAGEDLHRFMLSGPKLRTVIIGDGAETRLWAKSTLPELQRHGLQLALSVPESAIKAPIEQQFFRALVGLAIMAAVIFTGAALLGEFAIRRQTVRLMQAISRLDRSDFSVAPDTSYPRGEIGAVMQALDRLAGSLRQQQEDIHSNTEALKQQARIDPLTGLANRHMLALRLEEALIRARDNQRVAGVLMLDLDRFKTVNDSLGHSQGDLLLQEVARRLLQCVRDGDTVARLGGDEFVVVLSGMADVEDIVPVAQKILTALSTPVEVGPQMLSVSTSLGIALYPRDGETADALLQHADTAMYQAKERGGNAMAFFTAEMQRAMMESLQLEAGLRRALEANELSLQYQPIVSTATGKVVAAEALVRWHDPQRGMVSPLQFIPIAEETGLIIPLGQWVLEAACAQARLWRDGGLKKLPVTVNLSARQFSVPTLDETIAQTLAATGCPPDLLRLEITESSLMEHVDQALDTMHRLKAIGVQLVIDDFGTGYSSLSQVRQLPVTSLKIDRSFVRDIQIDSNDDVVIEAIVALAKKLSLFSVAEGVETEAQLAFLNGIGCDAFQGFLFSAPLDAADFFRLACASNLGGKPPGAN